MWPNLQFPADLVTFTEEILNKKLHFLCSDTTCYTYLSTIVTAHQNLVKITQKFHLFCKTSQLAWNWIIFTNTDTMRKLPRYS